MMLFRTVKVPPELEMPAVAPKPLPLLPLIVLLTRLTVPAAALAIPAPAVHPGIPPTMFPLNVLLTTLRVPLLLKMPAPTQAKLLLRVQLMTLTIAEFWLRMPPPAPPAETAPLPIVNPEKVTTPGLATVTLTPRPPAPLIVT